jgi:hypothetical protein
MQTVGYAALQIIPSFKGLDKNLEAGTSKAMLAAGTRGGARFGDAAGRSAGQRFGSMFATTAKAGLLGVGALGALAFKVGKDSIAQASDLNESLNAVNVTYEEQAKAVKKLGREAADSLGLSNTQFNGLAVQFSAFATKIAGGEGPKVIGILDDLTTRGADFASVMNLEVNEAMGLFQSGLAGETEPLRRFGIDLSAAAVQAYAYKNGIAEVGEELTEGEKVQARYGSLMEQTKKTQGDFANTSDSLANTQRRLNARWDDARAKLGNALLPIMEDAAGFLLDEGIPAFERFSDWFVGDGLPAIRDFADDMRPLARELLPAAGEALGIMADGAKKAAPFVRDLVGAFSDMPDWAKAALVGGGAALFAGKKLGVGSMAGGGKGVGGSGVVPVFVTNMGGGLGPGGGPGGRPGSGKSPLMSWGPIGLALTAGAVANDQFPEAMPFGDKGFAGDLDKYVITMDGITKRAEAAGRAVGGVGGEVDKMAAAFARLPAKVQTDMVLNGGPESRKEAMAVVRQYDLTPKEKRTLFEAYGIDSSSRTVGNYKDVLKSVPEKESTNFSIYGVEAAQAKLNQATAMLNNLDGRTYKAIIQLHTVRTGAGGQAGGYNGAADGGTVPKTGLGYMDRHHYLLADGEEVVSNRNGQADRWRPFLKAINANKLANGGTTGRAAVAALNGFGRVTERIVETLPRTIVLDAGELGRHVIDTVDGRITRHQRRGENARGYR